MSAKIILKDEERGSIAAVSNALSIEATTFFGARCYIIESEEELVIEALCGSALWEAGGHNHAIPEKERVLTTILWIDERPHKEGEEPHDQN